MKVAYFDCQFGAAGDMLCAALLANGLDGQRWEEELQKIALPEDSFEVAIENVMRCLIVSKKVTVKCVSSQSSVRHHAPEHDHHHYHDDHDRQTYDDAHHHDHDHHPHHGQEHHHDRHDNSHGETDSHGRSIKEIVSIIERSAISPKAGELSIAIFRNLAIAESRVHGVEPDDVHFHEVGAVDAIIDVVGFAIGYDLLGIEKSVVSPLTLGCGTVRTDHGVYPVPGPATVYLLEQASAPTTSLDIRYECMTPTGAAILTTIADRWGAAPAFQKIDSIGYGAGTIDPSSHPNVVRLFVGQCVEPHQKRISASGQTVQLAMPEIDADTQFRAEVVCVIEANIDDCPPNVIAYALEKALTEGALDISIIPAAMKKGRSGHLITVLAKPQDKRKFEQLLLMETSTLGVRSYFVERLVAEREFAEVKLSDWSIRIKIGRDLNGNVVNIQPEYEDCATYAQRHGLPLREVFEKALAEYALTTSD